MFGYNAGLLCAAERVDRHRCDFAAAGTFDDINARPLIDDRVVHHGRVRDVHGLVNDGRVVYDHLARPNALDETRFRDKYIGSFLALTKARSPVSWRHWCPSNVTTA